MRVVLFRTDKIGDLIVSTPVIAAIKAKYPQAKIMLVASPYNAVAGNGVDGVDQMTLFDFKKGEAEYQRTLEKIRAYAPNAALVLSPKHHCYWLSLQCGAKNIGWIVMEYRPWVRLLARLLLPRKNFEEIPRTSRCLHHSQHILNLAERIGIGAKGDFPYRVPEDKVADHGIEKHLQNAGVSKPFIAVHLVDKWIEENWKAEDVKTFLMRLRESTGLAIVATAGPADKILSEALRNDFLILQNLGFTEWVSVFRQAKLVISPDCSAVHIASALQKPLLALYQPSRIEVAMTEYGPRFTDFRVRSLLAPAETLPIFLNDAHDLLGMNVLGMNHD